MGFIKDTEKQIEKLAAQYVPEWHYDPSDPDIGTTIAKLFTVGMNENIGMLENMPELYHAEFVNMLDISLRPAKPAGSMVRFDLVENTVPGTFVRRGTRLISEDTAPDGAPILFETDRDIYVTNSRITDIFMTDREERTVVPLLGRFESAKIVEGNTEEQPEEEEGAGEPVTMETFRPKSVKPFVLFAETGNIARSVMILYHESVFDVEDEPILIRISGNPDLNEGIRDGAYVFRYYTEKGFLDFDTMELFADQETFLLMKHEPNKKVELNGTEYALVILEAQKPVTEEQSVKSIKLASKGGPAAAQFVSDGTADLDAGEFNPFSDTLSVYNECYIGHDLFFSKGGSRVRVTFDVSYKEHGLYLTKQEEESALKIVKRKPKVIASDIPAHAWADEIILEYFNGTGWRKLKCDHDMTQLFARESVGTYEISFICPSDWVSSDSGPFTGRSIRMRLLKSDNCYLRPGIHHYPHISGLKITFSYEESFMDPGRLFTITGTKKLEVSEYLKKDDPIPVFYPGDYTDDALYIGFDNKVEDGPVSIYFGLEDVSNQNALQCRFEYSTIRGFRQMKVVDYTGDFSRSGAVMFVPPSDFHSMELEGKRRFWIRVVRGKIHDLNENRLFLPRIRDISINIVSVSNIITGTEQDFYIDDPEPNMHFALGTRNILDAEVWVNERGSLSRDEMNRLLAERPDEVVAEYNMLGDVSAFYVKWNEADSFLNIPDRRRYTLDRLSNELIFSDSVKADIPRVTDDIAFKVRTRVSDGQYGNVGEGKITETVGPGLYIDRVNNPVRAYGGSSMETVEEALRRGANILHGRNRLVSVDDYIWTILNFSDSIDKAACIVGETIDGGKNPADISFVLLMKDFKDGSFSFHRIAAALKNELLSASEIAILPDRINITEPIFVSVSVSVWAEINEMDDSFETQNLIMEVLQEYFDPISSKDRYGWEIGVMPKRAQILMRLGALKSRAVIRKTTMVVHYKDHTGEHEMDLNDLKISPFMVCRTGNHHVHVLYK